MGLKQKQTKNSNGLLKSSQSTTPKCEWCHQKPAVLFFGPGLDSIHMPRGTAVCKICYDRNNIHLYKKDYFDRFNELTEEDFIVLRVMES